MRLRKLLLLNLLILASLFVACEKDDDKEEEAAPTPTETQYLYQVERVEIFEKGKSKYGSRGWSTQVVKLLEDENSESLRAEGFPEELVDKEPKNIGREL